MGIVFESCCVEGNKRRVWRMLWDGILGRLQALER